MCAEGYDVGGLDWQVADVERLLAGDADWVDISLDRYRRWLSELPDSLQGDLAETWGEASEGFRLPVLRCGKVMVLLQPDRGTVQDRKTGYHDMNCPPRHAYVALYAWLREQERIDAMIHLGTHGTLEWLPGKALALSAGCWPEAVLGPLPVIYPFIVNNPGEAVQAKRRLGAVTIGHLTPPLSAAGLHGALAEMEAIIEEYAAADGLDSRRLRHLEEEIVERAWSGGLAAECGLVKDEPSREAVAKLDAHLCDIKELSIREGLHVYGTLPDEAMIAQLAATMGGEDAPIRLSAVRERAGLLAALAGRRVAPGPAGAPTRGRADVLPTGRNLTSIDPRAIPTRTAAAIGARSADEVVRRYLQDHGEPPRALVIDLWASASLRTGGDDLAQALAYLGVRPVWDAASSRVTGIEVMPLATLDRPRIDATLRISGLFRDIFETQIALFDMAVRRVAELDEPDEDNPLAAARRAGADLSRIFGAAPGNYGAQAGDVALDGAWKTQADLGEIYLAAVTHAYGGVETVREAGPGFRSLVSTADLLVHPQDDRERGRARRRRRRRLCRRLRCCGGTAGQRSRTLSPRHKRYGQAARATPGGGSRPHRARPPHQPALDPGHAEPRPSRRGRDRPVGRCALCLRRDGGDRAWRAVRRHPCRADRRRGRSRRHGGTQSGGGRGHRGAPQGCARPRSLDDAAQCGGARSDARDRPCAASAAGRRRREMSTAAAILKKGWCPGALRPCRAATG